MRPLTFKGFLSQYLRAMSDSKTNDIKRLTDEVRHNYRLVEPLVLFAWATNKQKYLKLVAEDPVLVKAMDLFPDDMSWDDIISAFERSDNSIPNEFHKLYRSYICVCNRQEAKNHSKVLIHNRISELQREKKVSSYRIYTELKLNPGNINAYLKNGDVSKVGMEVAGRVLDYLEAM